MEAKKWYQSKTIWGVLIALLGFFVTEKLQMQDIPPDADTQQIIQYFEEFRNSNGDVAIIISQIAGILGSLLAIYGRIKADTTIKK